jgi:hypothetical protein
MAKKRVRRYKSLATELVKKVREAVLAAVQIFNNPQIEFKSELFIVTNVIAWTYLLHAHYRKKRIEYRRRKPGSTRFAKTKHGATYHWGLEECLASDDCPLDDIVKKNLMFLHERLGPLGSGGLHSTASDYLTFIRALQLNRQGGDDTVAPRESRNAHQNTILPGRPCRGGRALRLARQRKAASEHPFCHR